MPARETLLAKLDALAELGAAGGFADVRLRAPRLELGPPVGYPVQFRLVRADGATLRRIARQVRAAMRDNPHIRNISDNWGNLSKVVFVQVDQEKAQLLGISSLHCHDAADAAAGHDRHAIS